MADVALVGLPQRREVDADLDRLGRQAEDRRLPVHHARAAPRRGARRGSARRDRVRHGRRPGPGRGGRRRARASGTASCATSSVPGSSSCCSTWARPPGGARRRPRSCASCSASSAPTSPSCSSGPGWWSAARPTWRRGRRGRLRPRALGRDRRRRAPRWSSGLATLVTEARAAAAAAAPARWSCTVRCPRGSRCSGPGRRRGSCSGRAAERAVALLRPHRRRRAGRGGPAAAPARRRPRPGPGRAPGDGDEVTVGDMTLHLGRADAT